MGHVEQDQPRIWIRSYYASFNGIRAIAVLLVFLHHAGAPLLGAEIPTGLWVGVELFFVLSGFLITGILFDSLNDPNYFRNFYIRRALRIFPAYYLLFVVILFATPLLHLIYSKYLWSFPLYVGNVITPLVLSRRNPTEISWIADHKLFHANIGHLWSLCVEEQFYLTWPLIIYLVRVRQTLIRICVLGCTLIPVLRIVLRVLAHHGHPISPYGYYWFPFTRFDTLLWGAMLALLLRTTPLSRRQLHRLALFLFCVPALVIVGSGVLLHGPHYYPLSGFMTTIGYTLVALCSLGVVLYSLDEETMMSRVLQSKTLNWLGSISYGFYLYHALFLESFDDLRRYRLITPMMERGAPFLALTITLVIATLSFRFVESPFLRLKKRWAPQWVPAKSGLPVRLHAQEPQPSPTISN